MSYQQVDFVRKFGNKVYYGDASRLELLESARAHDAKLFVLAIDDVEASVKTAAMVRKHFPDLPILARARNRVHYYRLRDLGIDAIERETLLSSLETARHALEQMGVEPAQAARAVDTFPPTRRTRSWRRNTRYGRTKRNSSRPRPRQPPIAGTVRIRREGKCGEVVTYRQVPRAGATLARPPQHDQRQSTPVAVWSSGASALAEGRPQRQSCRRFGDSLNHVEQERERVEDRLDLGGARPNSAVRPAMAAAAAQSA